MRKSIVYSLAVASLTLACSNQQTPPNTHDAGTMSSNVDGGTTANNTVQNAVKAAASGSAAVEIDNAVVVAAYSYASSSGGTTGTFYIQDQAPNSTTGVSVYVSSSDMVKFPAVGDIVTVSGELGTYRGALQISGTSSQPLMINDTSNGGMSSGGAYPPAGTFTTETPGTEFSHSSANAHPELVGNALQFSGPLQVTTPSPAGFVVTKADGGTSTQGFEISNGIWVNDSNVYYDCMKGKGADGGTLFPGLESGVRGVWDRFKDPGSSSGPAYPVLVPMTCEDIGLDGGAIGATSAGDAGTTTDAGTTDAGVATDAGTTDAGTSTGTNTVEAAVKAGPTMQAGEVDNAVVIATYSYAPSGGGTTGVFYVQDQAPNSQNGLEVYVASTDTVTFPSVGDIVTVKGLASLYEGQLQLASSMTPAVPLTITKTGSNGMSSAGALPPAGKATMLSSTSGYEATTANAHPEQVGTVLRFAGPLAVVSHGPTGFVTHKADGGVVVQGFSITGGVWVDDSNVFYDCMRGQAADGGTAYPDLTNGIRGVWDHFQDGDAGTVYPVLVPMSCQDLNP